MLIEGFLTRHVPCLAGQEYLAAVRYWELLYLLSVSTMHFLHLLLRLFNVIPWRSDGNKKIAGGERGQGHSSPTTTPFTWIMFQRLIQYWVSNFITERLLASPTFHRMAAKTHQHVSSITNKGNWDRLRSFSIQQLTLQFAGSQVGNDFVKAFKENLEKERKNLRK